MRPIMLHTRISCKLEALMRTWARCWQAVLVVMGIRRRMWGRAKCGQALRWTASLRAWWKARSKEQMPAVTPADHRRWRWRRAHRDGLASPRSMCPEIGASRDILTSAQILSNFPQRREQVRIAEVFKSPLGFLAIDGTGSAGVLGAASLVLHR